MLKASLCVLVACVLLALTADGWLFGRRRRGHGRRDDHHHTHLHQHHHYSRSDFHYRYRKRNSRPVEREAKLVAEDCASLDKDPALGLTEDDVITAFRQFDGDNDGALLNAELGNFTNALELYEVCGTANNNAIE